MVNIAELLKDCPNGMELDCTMYEDVYFDYVDELNIIHCYIQHKTYKTSITFNQHGMPDNNMKSKCVIFPKGKTTWDGFVPPCNFKDGDIITDSLGTCIFKGEGEMEGTVNFYCGLSYGSFCVRDEIRNKKAHYGYIVNYRLATEEEKDKLFKAIKDNGYRWNAETNTLEKLVQPKFKAGDRIRHKNDENIINTISYVYDNSYGLCDGHLLYFNEEYQYELYPYKFDVNKLKPFDKVLVRTDNSYVWECDIFSSYNPKCSTKFHCIGAWYNICIPYKHNEHLRGTTNDCDEFYKIW